MKLNPMSFIITKTLKIIPIKQLFNSEEVALQPMDQENDGEIYVAINPNSIEVRTSTLMPSITGLIGNNYTDFTDVDNADEELAYTSLDSTGVIVGESVQISQGIALYTATVKSNNSNVIVLNQISGEPLFQPACDDILIFNHTNWYYISSSLNKVAIGDKIQILLEDDSSTEIKEVTYKDDTHIGFKITGVNYSQADSLLLESDTKLDGVAIVVASNDYPNGLKVIHKTTDSTVTNLNVLPKTDNSNARKFFF